jgi:transaldolase
MHTIRRLRELGQSVWLDFLDRALLATGDLDRMIADDGLAGLTSNPTIFQKAIAASNAYDDFVRRASPSDSDADVLERIMVREVTEACDRFRALYDATRGGDGFVSIEVSPELARDTDKTIDEARRLWRSVSRPNLMVKIPGTREGLPAIERCLSEGININITLLFAVSRYVEVAHAYLRALDARSTRNEPIDRVASVASFFVSRIDTKVDKALAAVSTLRQTAAAALRGKIAIANAKLAYAELQKIVAEDRFRSLAACGARPQRVLWASTSTKDPAYPDVYYPDALVGADTVDTMTKETFLAYKDHGRPGPRITEDLDIAREQIAMLSFLGIDFDAITRALEDEGVRLFAESHAAAMRTIAEKRRAFERARAAQAPREQERSTR